MSILYNNKSGSTPETILLAGNANTDQILNGTSKNAIANKAVYNALQDKIDKAVQDLVYYYTKSDVYNKAETRALLSTISSLDIKVVNSLPVSDISTTTIYFLKPTGSQNYDEYVYVDNAWVKIGDTGVDLSQYLEIDDFNVAIADYYTKAEIDAMIAGYYTKAEVNTLLDEIDTEVDTKQDILTFDNTPTAGSNNPVKSNGIYDAATDIYKVMGKNGAKNLLPNQAKTQTIGGVTYTINNDGTINMQGTNTLGSWISLNICNSNTLKAILSKYKGQKMIFSMTQDYEYDTRNVCLYYNISGTDTYIVPNPREIEFTVPNNIDAATSITVPVGVNVDKIANTTNLGIMLRLASDTDSTYQPYAETNYQLTQDKIGYVDNGILGAKNFLPNNGTDSHTATGVTFTKNADGTVTINGTATAYTLYNLFVNNASFVVENKNGLIVSALQNGVTLRVKDSDETWYGSSTREIIVPAGKNIVAGSIAVNNGTTLNNYTVGPMLRCISDPDPTYQPYAMTNQQLTKNLFHVKTTLVTFPANSIDHWFTIDEIANAKGVIISALACYSSNYPGIQNYNYSLMVNTDQYGRMGIRLSSAPSSAFSIAVRVVWADQSVLM